MGQFSSNLSGRFCVIQNGAGATLQKQANGAATGADLTFDATQEFDLAQVSAYYWTDAAHGFCADVLTSLPANRQLLRLPTIVNIDDVCNAFYDPSDVSINFFRTGTSLGDNCPNTAYSDVVLHEYGHAVDDMLGGIMDGGLSEGFGDAVAILRLRSPIVGRDFFGPGQHLRVATDVVTWPPQNPEVHEVGRIYGGFVWQLVEELRAQGAPEDEAYAIAKRLVVGAAAFNPSDIPDAVHLSFLIDDDDGDLGNGTPHFKALAKAADSREIPRPSDPDGT
jgi:hypothetical protein